MQERPQLGQRLRSMAQRMLHHRTQFPERAMIFGNEKERIVAEAAAATMVTDDNPMTASFSDNLHFALGIGDGRGANVIGVAPVGRQRRQLGQQPRIVRG